MKFCMSVWEVKVNVGLVLRLTKMLLELMLIEPVWANGGTVGVVDTQTEGWPVQVKPDWVWQLTRKLGPVTFWFNVACTGV